MTVQHNAITDPDIHEPKGIASATEGKVYVSDGASSGEWKYAPAKAHAEIYMTGGTTDFTLAAASGYTKLNPLNVDLESEWLASGFEDHLSVDPSNGEIDLGLSGHYYISFWITFDTAAIASGSKYYFKFALDGTTAARTVHTIKPTNGADTITLAASGLVNATANQALSIHVAGDGTSSGTIITPVEAGLTALFLD